MRDQVVEQLSQRIAEGGLKTLIGNNAYRRFLKIEGTKAEIDQKAVKEEELYDGKYVLMTNNRELSSAESALYYKELWRVERAFREMKSGLDLRPIYHWTDKRIRGHVMVCFLAFLLESSLRRELEQSGVKVRYQELMEELKGLLAVEVRHDGKKYITRTRREITSGWMPSR